MDDHVALSELRDGYCCTRTFNYSGRVLIAVDRIINLVVGGLTSLLLVTLISAFVFPQLPPKPVNIFFAFCISLCCISAGILIYWYRQGDLEPKFRNLIYYILFSIVMLCICANLYFHEVGK
uniref:Transmembrane protein 243 n=1 Tax=Nothoprocta perdicaria TaxID=30464 RepID=A0A8C6YPP3_NOTPE